MDHIPAEASGESLANVLGLDYATVQKLTDEELKATMENEGEKLGVYIYNRLEENVKRSELIFEVKEILIETITEKIALSTKLF